MDFYEKYNLQCICSSQSSRTLTAIWNNAYTDSGLEATNNASQRWTKTINTVSLRY